MQLRDLLSVRVWTLAPRMRVGLLGLIALTLMITATYVAQGAIVALVLATIFDGGQVTAVVPLIAGVGGLAVLRALLIATREVLAAEVAGRARQAVRQALVARMFDLGPGWLQRTRTGTVRATVVDGVEKLDPYVGRYLPQIVATVLGAAGVTAYVIMLDSLIGTLTLACGLLVPMIPAMSRRLMASRAIPWIAAYRKLSADTLDGLQGMATLKSLNASDRHRQRLAEQAQSFTEDAIRLTVVVNMYRGVVGLFVGVGTALAVGLGSVQRAVGELSTIELLTILILARECFRPMTDLQEAYEEAWATKPAGELILDLLDTEPDVHQRVVRPAGPVTKSAPALSFESVTFAYHERPSKALDAASLTVGAGERVALVGRSGSGKTTVVSLLLRFFEPQQGRICIGGTDIRDLPLDSARSMVAVVSQDTFLFYGTVRRNLALGRPEASQHVLESAARAARAHDFITALPQGYDTIVGERGLKLSGGERQRIAIARALLKNAPILVLDEATASIDVANEAGIQEALDALALGRTTLVIAHRLSTVRNADRIVVLAGGRVVEEGSPDALLSNAGSYARLVAAQEASR